jgi:hypothetical protein
MFFVLSLSRIADMDDEQLIVLLSVNHGGKRVRWNEMRKKEGRETR